MRSGYTPWLTAVLVAVPALCFWVVSAPSSRSAARAKETAPALTDKRDEPHFTTPDQLGQSAQLPAVDWAALAALADDGHEVSLSQFAAGRPLVIVFAKNGCPCGERFQPLFNRLRAALGDRVAVVGVIDAAADTAHAFRVANDVAYPLLADSDRGLIRRFAAKNGAYVTLIDSTGAVSALWPGCSAEMLRDLAARATALAGSIEAVGSGELASSREVTFDVRDAPGALTTGCPFDD